MDNFDMDVWMLVAIPAVSALTGLITTGVVMSLGGMGVLKSFHRRLILVEERIEDTDTRITREVKRRAADAAVAAKRTSPEQAAKDYMAEHSDRGTHVRPKVIG